MKTLLATLLLSAALLSSATAQSVDKKTAIFAGGCFWCVESDFDHVKGVVKTVSGYIGGTNDNPTYRNHSAGRHREAVEITYDPNQVTFERLLHVFWRSVDPTDDGGQFCDRGFSYTTAVYAVDDEQKRIAEKSKAELEKSGALKAKIVTPIEKAPQFWPAEDYHQDYYQKNPKRYKLYRFGCGRDRRVSAVWGDQAHSGIDPH